MSVMASADASRERLFEFERSLSSGLQLWQEFRYVDEADSLVYDKAAVYQGQRDRLLWVTWTTRFERRESSRASWNEFMGGDVTVRQPVQSFAGAFSWYLDWKPMPARDRLTVTAAREWLEVLNLFESMDKLRGWLA